MTEILHADNLAALSGVRHGFFTRAYGNPGLARDENRAEALQARAQMAQDLGVAADHLLSCYQIHSPDVVIVGAVTVAGSPKGEPQSSRAHYVRRIWSADQRPRADALVTNQKNIALGVLTADCVPVLFADSGAGVIGAAHAGWRGAVTGILENTVEAMEKLGASRKNIFAALGPCIWQKSYEVGSEFPAPFLAEDPLNEKFFRPAFKNDHYLFDLPAYAIARLKKAGLVSVAPSPADTCADPQRFFSHRYSTLRHEERQGNLLSAIALQSPAT